MHNLSKRIATLGAILVTSVTLLMTFAPAAQAAGPCNNGWYPGCVWYLN